MRILNSFGLLCIALPGKVNNCLHPALHKFQVLPDPRSYYLHITCIHVTDEIQNDSHGREAYLWYGEYASNGNPQLSGLI